MLQTIFIGEQNNGLQVLENFLENSPEITLSKKFDQFSDAINYCKNDAVDLVVCNIEIVDKEAVEIFKYYQPSTMMVCAGKREIIEAKNIEENIFGYLYKPFSYETIWSLINKATVCKGYQTRTISDNRRKFVFVKSDYKTIRIDLDDILYCEGLKDYTQIYLKGKAKPLVTLQNLKSFSNRLPEDNFVRVHRSFIVSMEKIDTITRNEIAVGNAEIPIGDAYREKLYGHIEACS